MEVFKMFGSILKDGKVSGSAAPKKLSHIVKDSI